MTVTQIIDWDLWRAHHPTLTFQDQQAFYGLVAKMHPEQVCFDPHTVFRAFDAIAGSDLAVVELGGWDGRMAAMMLGRGDIVSWVNYDLVAVPQVCKDARYRLEVLSDYLWLRDEVAADVFVAAHTIEHLTGVQLEALLDCLRVEYLYLEAPLPNEDGGEWRGYEGSHILEYGWAHVEQLITERGYEWAEVPNLWQR